LGILSAIFLSLLAIFQSWLAPDVYGVEYVRLTVLLFGLIPVGLVAIALAISYRWQRVGGILFIGLGTCWCANSLFGFGWTFLSSPCHIIDGLLLLTGILFLIDGWDDVRP
jgi:hypothetical protein